MKKRLFIFSAALLSIIQFNYGSNVINTNEIANAISEKDVKNSFTENFYSNYEANWKNLENFNTEFNQSAFASKQFTAISAPAPEADDCTSALPAVDAINFSESMLEIAMDKTYQPDNNQGCCYKEQPQGHMHPKRLKLEYIGSGNPWIVFRFKNSSGAVHFQGNVSNGQSLIVDGSGMVNKHGQEGLDTNTWYSIAGAAVSYHTSCSTNLDVGHTINGHFKVLAIEMPLVNGMGGVSCTEGDFTPCNNVTNAGRTSDRNNDLCTSKASNPLTIPNITMPVASGGEGGDIEYQWQIRYSGSSSWQDIPGANSKDYNPVNLANSSNGWRIGENYWRRKARRTCQTSWIYSGYEYYWIVENFQDPGEISGNESRCGSYDPNNISNSTGPSGGAPNNATIEYRWEYKTTGGWIVIPNENQWKYNPGTINQTTQYRRGARRTAPDCTIDYIYSNTVTKTVVNNNLSLTCEYKIDGGGWITNNCSITLTQGQKLQLSTNPNYLSSYSWTGPNNFSGSGNNGGDILLSNSVTTAMSGTYTVIATDSNGCTGSKNITVNVVCPNPANNTTATASINENQTKTLTGSPSGGSWSIVSGGGTINGSTYTPANINTNTNVKIRYTIAANGSCAATSDDVTFTVTPVCITAGNTTSSASITADETKTLVGTPTGGTWSIVSGAGSISENNGVYTFTPITNNIIYATANEDGNLNLQAPVGTVINSITFASYGTPTGSNGNYATSNCHATNSLSIVENYAIGNNSVTIPATNTVFGDPCGGTRKRLYVTATYSPSNSNTNSDVTLRYTIPADGSCPATSDDVTFTVTPVCTTANNTTATASINENQTKTLTGSPSGGSWSIVSGGGTINGSTYTPANINTNTTVKIRYTIAAVGSCAATSDDVMFTVTPVCVTADNTTSNASITEAQTKTLTGTPSGGSWSIVSGGGSINGTTYTPDDINTNTIVKIRYTIAADGSCASTNDDVTFTVTPVCDVVANNTSSSANITESETKTLTATPSGGTWSIISGGGSINGTTYTPDNVNDDTSVTIRYTIASDGDCSATNSDVTFNVKVLPEVSVSNTNVTCYNLDDGSITFTFTDTPSRSHIEFSLDGGNTYQNHVPLSYGSITYSNLEPDTYDVWVRWGNNQYPMDLGADLIITEPAEIVADNTTSTATINEGQTKSLTATPSGGTWSIVSGGGTINGSTYTPANINTNTTVKIRYTIAANGSCAATSDDVTFTVTPVCTTANNTTSTAAITEGQTKTLIATPAGGTWSIVSGGGSITGTTYTPDDINTDTTIVIRYTIAADGDCAATTDDVTFTVTTGLGSIGDTVWFDTDGDAIKDANEDGLGGATVTLDPGTPGDPSDDTTATTDVNGNYLFNNLPPGHYIISVDVSAVTSGIPVGKTPSDLIQTYDFDSVGTPNNSAINLPLGQNNLDQDFAYGVSSGNTGTGNNGGVESESLGDAISKIYVGRKKNSMPTEFVKSSENLYNKVKLKSIQPYQGKGQTLLDMFPTELVAGNVANVTSPTDILDYTIADEVLSVDFSINGETKGVVLGIKTSDKIYNHTKASCDRLRGAEILNVQKVRLEGYNFLMQGIKQRNGVVEYAISFAVSKNNNDDKYTIQTNWYVNNYIKFNDAYNFQVWSTKPADTQKLVQDILDNLKSYIPVQQTEVQKFPETYASKIYREKGELVVNLRSTEVGNTAEVSMVELYSETANNIKHRYNSLDTEIQQSLRLDIADGYEYDGLVTVEDEVEDAFYHADGNWGLDYDSDYTEILNYFVWNDFDRTYQDDEYSINRNVEIKATSEYDYLTVYKSLLPGTLSADYSEYKYLSFTAKGSGLMELGLIKSSIERWKQQYRVMVDLSKEEQTYYVPFDIFSSTGTTNKITADDLTTLAFTFLPVEANTKDLDLFISNVKFTKTAIEDQIVNKIEKFENNFMAYPNPSKGSVNVMIFSKVDTKATISLFDVTGKEIYVAPVQLINGKNEIDFNVKVKPGVLFLKVNSKKVNYGVSKIMFR